MTDATEHNRTMFVRQRRNLMGVSIVLLFVTYSGLKLTTLNILGNNMAITRPHIVNVALWVAFLYWFWRYWVYRVEIRTGTMFHIYKPAMFQRTVIGAKRQIDASVQRMADTAKNEVSVHSKEWAELPSMYNPFFIRKIKLELFDLQVVDGVSKKVPHEVTMELDRALWGNLVDWLYVMRNITFRTAYVSEYIAPPSLAVTSAILTIVHYL